jgi:hypothetical protein
MRNRSHLTKTKLIVLLLMLGMVLTIAPRVLAETPSDNQTTAADAYIYGYAMLYNYKTMFQQAVDPSFPGYVGGFGRFRHYSRGFTPADADIVTPSNDTPYSWAWLDLRAEPWVVSLPAIDRYYVLQWFDLYTHNFAYLGSRATGSESGNYLFAGPGWNGEVPKGITKVIRAETDFVGTLTRTSWTGPEETEVLKAIQSTYRLMPLSEFAGTKPPSPAPALAFPAWDEARASSPDFISYLNFLLQFCPMPESERKLRERFAKIGIGAGQAFDAATLAPEARAALVVGIEDGKKRIDERIATTKSSADIFGTREFLGEDFAMKRAVAAAMGIYGNSKEEAYYTPYVADAEGKALDGTKRYVIHFAKEQVPPVKFFWSMTMYNLPQRLLVENPIKRYAIGSRTPGFKLNADGSADIYLQSESPGKDKESNWLPTPKEGPYYMVMRKYGPKGSLANGTWKAPLPVIQQ